MTTCRRRQRVITNGQETHRCIHRSSDVYGQEVDIKICMTCQFNRPKTQDFNIWDVECGPCVRRTQRDGEVYCTGVARTVTVQECVACLNDQRTYSLDVSPQQAEPPSTMSKINNYRLAIQRWMKAGRPVRTPEEVQRLFREVCEPCDWFDEKTFHCKDCGCRVAPNGMAIFNKLRMATESCPQAKF